MSVQDKRWVATMGILVVATPGWAAMGLFWLNYWLGITALCGDFEPWAIPVCMWSCCLGGFLFAKWLDVM